MYHVVTAPPAGTAYPELWVPWKSFVAQMLALHKRGFHGVTLEQVRTYWDEAIALPRKPIVISFDDGYLSQYTHAAHTLRALHWPGVLNLVTHNIGPGGLTKHQVASLIEDGWELDSHTISHLDLTTLGAQQLRHELAGSRAKLRRLFGVGVDWFCYPAGRFNATVEAAVRAAGYRGATTTQPGIAGAHDDRFALPRVRVDGTDSAADVIAKLKSLGAA
jgi:peptidoglycan/xylan/chitin deacetylase (PgdA/CDA1 family)